MEILSFCRRELAAAVNPSAQMLHHAVVAVKPRHGLAINYEMRAVKLLKSNRKDILYEYCEIVNVK